MKEFDLDVVRNARPKRLFWPARRAAQEDGYLGGNHRYLALVKLSWLELEDILKFECELMERVGSATDPADEEDVVYDELLEEDVGLQGLDIGVASAVVALSAAGCIPFSSCNGGAFGREHFEDYPLVAFYARAAALPLLLECAEHARVGLINGDEGELVLHADRIEKMVGFARAVSERARAFDHVR
jgi:hypothetical protein